MSASDMDFGDADDRERQWERTAWTMYHVEESDEIIWDGRTMPLEVDDVGGNTEDNSRYIVARGPANGRYTIRENYSPGGTPSFNTEDSGEAVSNLRITRRAGTDMRESGASAGDDTTLQDKLGWARETYPEFFDDEGNLSPGEEAMEPDPERGQMAGPDLREMDEDTISNDADDVIEDATDGDFSTYSGFLDGMVRKEGLVEDRTLFSRDPVTHTAVDEFVALGIDVPQTVGEWTLVDYGIVQGDTERKLIWINSETDEMVAMVGARVEDASGITWHGFHADDWTIINAKGESFEADLITADPEEMFDFVRERLYDGVNIDVQVIERRTDDGQTKHVLNQRLENKTLGSRIMDALGIEIAVPSVPGAQQTASLIGSGASKTVNWFADNEEALGKIAVTATSAVVHAASRFVPGVSLSPIIEKGEDQDEDGAGARLGLKVDGEYRYEGDRVPIDTGAGVDTELAINTSDIGYDFTNSTLVDRAWEVADVANIEDVSLEMNDGSSVSGGNPSSSSSSGSAPSTGSVDINASYVDKLQLVATKEGGEDEDNPGGLDQSEWELMAAAFTSMRFNFSLETRLENIRDNLRDKRPDKARDDAELMCALHLAMRGWEKGKVTRDEFWSAGNTKGLVDSYYRQILRSMLETAHAEDYRLHTPSQAQEYGGGNTLSINTENIRELALEILGKMQRKAGEFDDDGGGDDGDDDSDDGDNGEEVEDQDLVDAPGDQEQIDQAVGNLSGDDSDDGDDGGNGDGDGDGDGSNAAKTDGGSTFDPIGEADSERGSVFEQWKRTLDADRGAIFTEGTGLDNVRRADQPEDLNPMGEDAFEDYWAKSEASPTTAASPIRGSAQDDRISPESRDPGTQDDVAGGGDYGADDFRDTS